MEGIVVDLARKKVPAFNIPEKTSNTPISLLLGILFITYPCSYHGLV